jgi:PhzF family phenazine biosynthesis protein
MENTSSAHPSPASVAAPAFGSTVRRFAQVDVFAERPLLGNPVAVVLDGDGLDEATMAAFARWTNLSETTFIMQATSPDADYRLRIFTPGGELPFAGHPTLGSCHAWLRQGAAPRGSSEVVQECAAGLVRIRRDGDRLAFAAPPLLRTGELEPDLLTRVVQGLGLQMGSVRATQWVDNGPGWLALLIDDRDRLLAIRPDRPALSGLCIGVVAPWPDGPAQFEVRAFIGGEQGYEDPGTGSLNASLAQWLIGAGLAPARYVASQGTVLHRSGRVHLERVSETIWVGGATHTVIEGSVLL